MPTRPTHRSIVIVSLAGAAALATGCSTWHPRVNTTQEAEREGKPTQIKDERLIWDENLAKAIQLVGLIEGTAPNGLRKVEAELFNAADRRVAIRYRFEWFDAEGFAVDSLMDEWRDRALLGGERARISAVAPNDRAVDFELEIIGAP
jgi:uncharacterized protein YcfL